MTAAQTRIAESLEIFYGSADRASEGAMAGHAYKRSVDDLDGGFGRELVGTQLDTPSPRLEWTRPGRPLSDYDFGTAGQDVCLLPCSERTYIETEQESASAAVMEHFSPNCFATATRL
jgi:hypothetical protein